MSKYGETHDIFNNHHVQTKAKLDALLSKNTEIEVNNDGVEALLGAGNASHASINSKITACNTGACVVSSSALPAGASSESSLAAMSAKITACNTGACVVSSSALPAGASSESSLAAMSAKITSCNTGACVVSSSALPAGASVSSKQDEIKTLITATNSALAGTLTVSAPAASKSSSTPISNQAINGQSLHTSGEIDINTAKHISLIGSSTDSAHSHELDLLVSNVSGGVFYKTSHSGYFQDGDFHLLIAHVPYRFIKIQLKNTNAAVGMSGTFDVHLLQSS